MLRELIDDTRDRMKMEREDRMGKFLDDQAAVAEIERLVKDFQALVAEIEAILIMYGLLDDE